MSVDRLEAQLPRILAELGAGAPPDYAATIVERTAGIQQRPAWAVPGRWVSGALAGSTAATVVRWRLVIALALLVIVIVAAIGAVVGSRRPTLPTLFNPGNHPVITYGDAGDVFVGVPLTGQSQVLVSGPEYDTHPVYSPDGTRIAFLRRVDPAVDGATNIVVAAADGTGAVVITATALEGAPGFFLWTPDGRSITVQRTTTLAGNGGTTTDLVAFDVAGPGPPRVINPKGLKVSTPWAFQPPDGRRILFRGDTVGRSEIGLYVANADGSGATPLVGPYGVAQGSTAEFQDLTFASWSPDGKQIAYQQVTRDDLAMGVWVMNADGSGKREVGRGPGDTVNGWAWWSPDGTRIVFQRETGATSAGGYYTYTWRVVRLSDGHVVDTGPVLDVDSDVVWSPDGTQVLVWFKGGQHELLLDPDGGPARELPWSPVGGDWRRTP